MKKLIAIFAGVAMTVTLAACSPDSNTPSSGGEPASAGGDTIYVLGPTPDHGWTAQAGTYAEAKVSEINAAGKWKAQYLASSDGEAQNDLVQQVIANGNAAGVLYFALDDSAQAGAEAMIGANIPFMFFDRIIDGPDKSAILNFSGDNWAVGAGIAYWLQKNGMKPGDALVTLIGDNGTVSGRRQEGFDQFLLGEREYNDKATGQTSKTTEVWTQEQVSALSASYKEVCDWSADKAYQYLEQKLPDIISDAKSKGGSLYVFSMDDEMTFGFLNLIEGNTLDDATKKDLEDLKLYISAIGGMAELYAVMDGSSNQSALAGQYFDDMMSVSFNPKMMQTAIDYMLRYVNQDNWTYPLGAGEYEPVWIVDKSNVSQYEGFTGH
ncbi:MAG: substrate-binding domain-containing protein [Propionibacteriaceae bacterium]|jgi:ribose transport system substrate-binding protein|nr:substrate-binding domain-containing protein [Propionibacteriaceae bacterium]